MEIKPEETLSSSRKRLISKARALISYLAICEMGYSGIEVSRNLDIKGASVSECVETCPLMPERLPATLSLARRAGSDGRRGGKKILENESDIRQNLIS